MKYWITDLKNSSINSSYTVRLTLTAKPENEDDILKWMISTFGKFGFLIKIVDQSHMYSEIYLKDENDATSFILRWGDSLQ